jgi:hypothetical protein
MPETPVSRARAATERSPSSARDSSQPSAVPQVKVNYYRRMRPNRVYPFTVSWKGGGRGSGEPVVVRLVMGGAQVVPAEQTLDPAKSGDRATFYVTPLARGWLRGERLEVVQDGRKVQEIRLPCKVTTQRLTWVLLLLTIVVAWWIAPIIVEPIKEYPPPTPQQELEGINPQHLDPAKSMAKRVSRYLPHVLPAIREHLPKDAGKSVAEGLESVPERIGDFYMLLYNKEYVEGWPIAEGLIAVMVLLTLFSWFIHLERRKSRVGKPVAGGGRDED